MKNRQKQTAKDIAMVKATYQDTAFNKAVSDIPAHTPEFKTYVDCLWFPKCGQYGGYGYALLL